MTASPPTLGEALAHARRHLDPVDARILLCAASGHRPADLIARPERLLTAEAAALFQEWCGRRAAGEPVAYLIGGREFYGHWLEVTPSVLIPRPETELLVERTLAAPLPENACILDMGTGSGAIAIALALARPNWQVWAIDQSPEALALAQKNAARLGAKICFAQSDWFAALPAGQRFHAIISNPPYIAENDHHLSQGDVRFEPRHALTAGQDGLDDLRHITELAPRWLHHRAPLLLEHGYDQAPTVRALLRRAGLENIQSWQDLAGIERVSGGVLP